ncbi:MAG: hypothetical protein HOV81_13290 [Kofleriaceae bacterium]|nr:hypothetical protein [Kofleriaceae bacterium]
MQSSECHRRTLAASDFMLVEQCSCGSIHVTIGAVTLRLAKNALPAIAATLGDAARNIALRDVLSARGDELQVLS